MKCTATSTQILTDLTPTCSSTGGEISTGGSDNLQSQVSGYVWSGSLVGILPDLGTQPKSYIYPGAHSMILPKQGRKFTASTNC